MKVVRKQFPNPLATMKGTLVEIGKAIQQTAEYLPIRNHAAALATTAPPKDYIGQLRAVYNDFIRRWRYVRDPAHKELVTASPEAVWKYLLAGDGIGLGKGKGGGDCDCASVAIGGQLLSIGFPIRLATTSDFYAPAGNLFGHVFVQAQLPNGLWLTVDPVLHPRRKFGAITPHSRIAYWDLSGNLIGYKGNVKGALDGSTLGGEEMQTLMTWPDYSGMLGFTPESSPYEPEEWETVGLKGWGVYSPSMGVISGDEIPELLVEADQDLNGLARTPMIELAPDDYKYVQVVKTPYDGMLGLGDNGEVYAYDGSLGFFKKLFRRVKKRVKKVAKRIGRGLKSVLKKLPGGKALIKIASKIHKVAMKFVRPLAKFVGKYAAKLAPVAALIPGWGPAIAAGLYTAGKVAKLMTKYGVKVVGRKGKTRTLTAKAPKQIKQMQRELAAEAKKLARRKRG
jgi:hypothetical protein